MGCAAWCRGATGGRPQCQIGFVRRAWDKSPQQSVADECDRRGRGAVVRGCIDLLQRRDVDDGLILALGGPAARAVLDGREGGRGGYWPRVWAARGLLHVWEDEAAVAITDASGDDAWRVREMAAKVVARHRVDQALEAMLRLRDDPVARVRAIAIRAIESLTGGARY